MLIYIAIIVLILVWNVAQQDRSARAYGNGSSLQSDQSFPKGRATPVFFALVLILVAGLRMNVGTDYRTYTRLYDQYVADGMGGFELLAEPMLRLFAVSANQLDLGHVGMFLFAAAVTIGLSLTVIYRHSSLPSLAFLVYVLSSSWQGSFNGVRQYLAAALILWACSELARGRRHLFLVGVSLAIMSHLSAVIALLFAFVPMRRMRIPGLALLLAVAFAMTTQTDVLLATFDYARTEMRGQSSLIGSSYGVEAVNPIRIIFPLLPALVLLGMADASRLQPFHWFSINMMLVTAAVYAGSLTSAYVARSAIYPAIFACIAIPALVQAIPQQRERRAAWLLVISAYGIFWWFDTTAQEALLYFRFFWSDGV